MGNTCYMNSILQCLSHTPILRQYFTSRSYLNDINAEAPCGHGGKLAQVFANLINDLWNPERKQRSAVAPKDFKRVLGKLRDQVRERKSDGGERHLKGGKGKKNLTHKPTLLRSSPGMTSTTHRSSYFFYWTASTRT